MIETIKKRKKLRPNSYKNLIILYINKHHWIPSEFWQLHYRKLFYKESLHIFKFAIVAKIRES